RAGATIPPLRDRALAGPLFAVVYAEGKPQLQLASRARTLAAAVAELRPQLRSAPPGRLKVDVTLACAPILRSPEPLFALSLVPGVDGMGGRAGDHEAFLPADDLLRADVLAARQPTRAMEFELGADADAVDRLLAAALGLDEGAYAHAPRRYFRFRTDG